MRHFDDTIPVETIVAGKLRRYNNLPLWRQLLRPLSIVLPNLRDLFLVVVGCIQSVVKLVAWRPDVVFTKGGFVCLPVGIAAKILHIPLVIHDSDAHPGLTSRILAKWAVHIGTGAPLKYYPYPVAISKYVGIPISSSFREYSATERYEIKSRLGFNPSQPLVVVTGGGLGARRINDAVASQIDALTAFTSVLLVSGNDQYEELLATTPQANKKFQLKGFISDGMADILGAADIVVTRAGATTILELAALAKPTLLIPNGYLTGGHQLKNAAAYADVGAVAILDEHELDKDMSLLTKTLKDMLARPMDLQKMGTLFKSHAKPNAASDTAAMIISAVKK